MAGKLSRLKPNASSSVHLFVAASLWTVVGIVLMSRGVSWLSTIDKLWIIIPAFLTGTLKSLYMLDKSAKKSINRIVATRDGRCIGGVYSVKTWLLVLVMMTAGYLMRHSSLPKEFLGLFYVSIGWGLLFSSRNAWLAWKNNI
ncbi:MAG TPA: hypothetical protein EYG88_15340 [Desulfocapsa sulfexigens]|nr:hypothetical protein [Desulfocapsa sulfexigens]